MTKLKETYLKKYGVWEYVLFVLGFIILLKTTITFWKSDMEALEWTTIGIMSFFIALGSLLISKPLTILDLARKRIGMETREDKFKDENDAI